MSTDNVEHARYFRQQSDPQERLTSTFATTESAWERLRAIPREAGSAEAMHRMRIALKDLQTRLRSLEWAIETANVPR